MAKTITTRKQELCWLYHEHTWTEQDYLNWKGWVISIAERNDWDTTNKTYVDAQYIALAKLIKDLDWDEVAIRFAKGDDLELKFEATGYDGSLYKHTIHLINSLADAMGEDAWDAGYEIGDACDTDTDYEYNFEVDEEE